MQRITNQSCENMRGLGEKERARGKLQWGSLFGERAERGITPRGADTHLSQRGVNSPTKNTSPGRMMAWRSSHRCYLGTARPSSTSRLLLEPGKTKPRCPRGSSMDVQHHEDHQRMSNAKRIIRTITDDPYGINDDPDGSLPARDIPRARGMPRSTADVPGEQTQRAPQLDRPQDGATGCHLAHGGGRANTRPPEAEEAEDSLHAPSLRSLRAQGKQNLDGNSSRVVSETMTFHPPESVLCSPKQKARVTELV